MAKVEQKVGLDVKDYKKGAKELSRTAKTETDRVGKEFDKAGDDVKGFSDRTKKNVGGAQKSFGDLAKGFRASLGAISAAGAGLAIGSAITKEVSESLDFQDTINRATARLGLNQAQGGQFQNQLIDVASRRNVEEEEVAAAANAAVNLGATAQEAIKFADAIATATKSFEGLEGQSAELADTVAKDIRARGGEVTGAAALETLEAIVAGTRSGIGDFNQILGGLTALPGRVQERAGLSQRDLTNLLGGAAGVAADPEIVNDAVRSLIKATDSIETRGAVQGVLGTQLRDSQGNFNLTAKNLDEIAKNIQGLGDEQQQRAVLGQISGFDDSSVEGLLALVRDRQGFGEARGRTAADTATLAQVNEQATSGVLEQVGGFFNRLGNELFKRSAEGAPETAQFGKSGQLIGKSQEELNAEFEQRLKQTSALALPQTPSGSLRDEVAPSRSLGQELRSQTKSPTTPGQQNRPIQPVASPGGEMTVKVEVDSKDPGLIGRPKANEVQRQTGGL